MTNDTFHSGRFGRYLVADLRNAWSGYGLTLLILSLAGTLYYLFNLLVIRNWGGFFMHSRAVILLLCLAIVLTTVSRNCYGWVTDRKRGARFLMLPVSSLEKTLSMLLVCGVAAPACFLAISLGADALLCRLDPSCGNTLACSLAHFFHVPVYTGEQSIQVGDSFILRSSPETLGYDAAWLAAKMNAWLYLGEALSVALLFLLGALVFRKGKISKTFLLLLLLTFLSLCRIDLGILSAEQAQALRIFFRSHAVLMDILKDTFVNLLLSAAIFFRVKTIKL